LDALDRAIELNPRYVEAHDLKAKILAESQRFTEALAACHHPCWASHLPPALQVRAAWVEAQRGNLPQAINQIRQMLVQNPGHYPGWRQLADWLCQNQQYEEAQAAALSMARLAPSDPIAHGYLADLKLRLGDRAGAGLDFRKAVELAPGYGFAGFSLFDLELEDGDLEGAAKTLQILQMHVGGDWVLFREAQLALRHDNQERAVEILLELAKTGKDDPGPGNAVLDLLQKHGLARKAEKAVSKALRLDPGNHGLDSLWVQVRLARNKRVPSKRLNQLSRAGDVGRQAVLTYLETEAEHGKKWSFRRAFRRHRTWLREQDRSWGLIGFGLVRLRAFQQAAIWLAGWKERKGVEPWMLYNLVLALQATGREAEALEAMRHALQLGQTDSTLSFFKLWLAFEELLAGDRSKAEHLLENCRRNDLDEMFRSLLDLAQNMIETRRAAEEGAPVPFDRARKDLLKQLCCAIGSSEALRRLFFRSLRLYSQACRPSARWTPGPLVWGYTQAAWKVWIPSFLRKGLITAGILLLFGWVLKALLSLAL
jgi:tetratricopeptide (TPR) repeat protein